MYYQNYEDYMRQVLGYPISDPNIYESYDYRNRQTYEDTYSSREQFTSNMSEEEIRACYPEIYNLVYPMVCKVCDANTEPITRELIEKMTDEVYHAIEDTSTVVNIRVDTPQTESINSNMANRSSNAQLNTNQSNMTRSRETISNEEKRNSRSSSNISSRLEDTRNFKSREENVSRATSSATSVNSDKQTITENRATRQLENRQFNSNLRDLIKILILFRLFGNRPIRPRPRPPRPPFPGGPGRPPFTGGRPYNFYNI